MRISKFVLLCAMALCAVTLHAELVPWLKDDVKALMKYEDFPTAEEAIQIIPDTDPLANLKRTEVLHTLINLTDFYPIFQEGKWKDLAVSYKRTFKQMGGQWPLEKEDKMRLAEVGFESYPIVMETWFPEAFKLKPTTDGSHKQKEALGVAEKILAALLILIVLLMVIRMFRKR